MLATETTMVINLKVVTVLVCLVWRELEGQNQQLSQELKEECFAFVAGRSVKKLLELAHSFTEASWCACHVKEVLTIMDTLIDVLYNVKGLPLNGSDEVASISCKIEDALKGILDGTTDDISNREESAVHPANFVLIQVLEFFHDNSDMVQSLMAAGNPCCDMLNSWESKIKKDTERIPQHENDKMYIILLNNAYDVWQMMRRPGAAFSDVELVSRLICMIQRCRKSYFDECWVPLIMPLVKEDYLKSPGRACLDEFTQGFVSICNCQMTWKVLPALKYELRDEIKNVVVPPYKAFLRAVQANPSQLSEVVYSFKRFMRGEKNQNAFTPEQLEYKIEQFFES
jgi:hypothetical protein